MAGSDSPDATSQRRLDAAAVAHALHRLAAADQPPWLHTEIARRMGERLEIIRLKPTAVIDWWGWLGAGAPVLAQACPQAHRTVVEPTAALAERSRAAARKPWWSASRWNAAPVAVVDESAPLPEGAQLVWSNMALHAAADPPALFERWLGALAVDGFVMFSCLGPGTLRELRTLYAEHGWPAPTPDFIDMHDLGDMLVHAGFADPVMDQETLTLRWDSPQALLAELHGLGGNAAPDRSPGLRTPRWRAQLLEALQSLAGADGRIGLSFEVAYGHAFKAAPKVRVAAETSVSLQDMRAMVRTPRGGAEPGSLR